MRLWRGRVAKYIEDKVGSGETLHFSLVDPAKTDVKELPRIAEQLVEAGTDAFLVGGSLAVSESDIDEVIEALRTASLPIILFPGNINGISRKADAILFMSLLNSDDIYYVTGAQVSAAPIIKRYGLEVLPTAYIIVGYGGAAGFMGRARPIPYDKPEIAAAYAMAAEMMGMRFIYLEAGSGAPKPVPTDMVSYVRQSIDSSIVIVGGGIRSPEVAQGIVRAGADVIVTGNIIEDSIEQAKRIIRAVKKGGR
ncbi:MAG: geranylgeranylglyceryl/heptaprenylglyceryl phosphate synthase [Thermoprotei archaeon]|nr:MAG: geranylgeranylglyceryl/heptaprenylglyceryl phosphate synthase [Thermoprotei archaeon]